MPEPLRKRRKDRLRVAFNEALCLGANQHERDQLLKI